jgi:hypothetical protein
MRPLPLHFLLLALILLPASITHANARPQSPFERLTTQPNELVIDVKDADANELIPRILERTGLQYTFIRSPEERLLSLKTKAQPSLILETVAFSAGFNIHRNGNYWVIYPITLEHDVIN